MQPTEQYAVLWDLDGVLVDTGSFHYQAWKQIAAEMGRNLTPEDYRSLFGMTNQDTIAGFLGAAPPENVAEEISLRKEAVFRSLIRGQNLTLPGALHWLARLKQAGVKQSLATSAPPENIEVMLGATGALQYFDAVVSGHGHPGKPDPWVFLEAARVLGVPAQRCVVMEDSRAGVQAARRAGMRCIAVTNTLSAAQLLETGAERAVGSLEDLTGDLIFAGLQA